MRSGLGMRRLACIGLVRCLCELTARRTNQALWAPANWPHGRESGTRVAEQQYTWPHYCRGTNRYADRGAPTTGTASEPILTKGSAGLPTLADPSAHSTAGHRVNRTSSHSPSWDPALTSDCRCCLSLLDCLCLCVLGPGLCVYVNGAFPRFCCLFQVATRPVRARVAPHDPDTEPAPSRAPPAGAV